MSTTISDTLAPELGTKKVPVNYQYSPVLIEIVQPGSMSVKRFTASVLVLSPTLLLQSPFPLITSEHSPCSAPVRRCALRRPAAMTSKKE